MRIISVGYKGGPIIHTDEGPIELTNAEAFHLVDQLVRAIRFPEDEDE